MLTITHNGNYSIKSELRVLRKASVKRFYNKVNFNSKKEKEED